MYTKMPLNESLKRTHSTHTPTGAINLVWHLLTKYR